MMSAKTNGQAAEDLAANWLRKQGLTLVERNYRVRGGEIDLICKDRKTLVFVEVRLRSNAHFGGAAASIGRAKQQRIILAAQHYLSGKPECDCRFDCILLNDLDERQLEWIKGAFTL